MRIQVEIRCPECASPRVKHVDLPGARGHRLLFSVCEDCEYLFDVETSE